MTSIQVYLREAVRDRIIAIRDNTINIPEFTAFVIPDFDIEDSYFPRENLEDLIEKPKVKLVSIGFPTNRDRLLRNKTLEVEVPVQIAVQQKVDSANVAVINLLVELIEQVQIAAEDDYPAMAVGQHGFSWMRTEPLRDENALAYSYQDLTTKGVFQGIFTCIYKHLLQRG